MTGTKNLPLDNEYINENGLVAPNLRDPGENGIYFRAQLDLWCLFNGNEKKYDRYHEAINATFDPTRKNYFRANPPASTDHFSLDNMLGLYIMCALHQPNLIKKLPISYWNGVWHLHPNTWMVHLAYKHKVLRYVFWPFIFLMVSWSGFMSPCNDTTGFNLWWCRLILLDMGRTLQWLRDIVETKMEDCQASRYGCVNAWDFSFSYYYTLGWRWGNNWDHPIIKEVQAHMEATKPV